MAATASTSLSPDPLASFVSVQAEDFLATTASGSGVPPDAAESSSATPEYMFDRGLLLPEPSPDPESEEEPVVVKLKGEASKSAAAEDTEEAQTKETLPRWCDLLGNIDIRDVDPVDTRSLRIYLDGVFDVTHFGHYRLFRNVKLKFPNSTIIVGVSGDEETQRLKGHTVLDENERSESVEHCRWVDEVICPCAWIITDAYLRKHAIDYVAHDGDPYVSTDSSDIYDFVKRRGKFIATQRTEGISTTELINRIVRRYNEFVVRNLKRGVDRGELNLSWTREQRIRLREALKSGASKVDASVAAWLDDPSLLINDFLDIFGPRGKVAGAVKEQVEKIKTDFVEYAQFAPM